MHRLFSLLPVYIGSHVISPVLIEAIHFFLIIQLHVQLVVKATATIATEDAEQGIFKKK